LISCLRALTFSLDVIIKSHITSPFLVRISGVLFCLDVSFFA